MSENQSKELEDEEQKAANETQSVQASEKGFFEELLGEAFNVDRGIFATVFNMFKNPGLVIDSYFKDRKRFTNPFRYAIVVLAATTLITSFVIDYEQLLNDAMEAGIQSQGGSREELSEQLKVIAPDFDFEAYLADLQEITIQITTKFVSVLYIVVFAPIVSLFTYLFYSGRRKRFVEHYVMNLYGMTQGAIFTLLLAPVAFLFGGLNVYMSFVSSVILLTYIAWVVYSYVPGKGIGDVFKIAIALLLSYAVFSIILAILMYVGAAIKYVYF